MATAPELIASTANGSDEAPAPLTGEVIEPNANGTAAPAATLPAVDPSLNSGRSLDELETVIEHSIESQVQAGIALLEINARAMYKESGFDSFAGYLQSRWGYLSAGYKLMDAAKVQLALTSGGQNSDIPLPKNEAQAREIAPLVRRNPEAARDVWQTLVSSGDPAQITAADIKSVVQAKLAELRPVKPEGSKVAKPETDGVQIGPKDQAVRFKSFYGDDTVLGAHLAPNGSDLLIFRVGNRRDLQGRMSDLAETAVSRLKKGGSALFLTSPALLPAIFAGVDDLLTYKWTIVRALEIGKNDRDDKPSVYNGYEAIVWFTKGKYTGEIVNDILDLEGDGFKGLVELLVPENGLIGTAAVDQAEIGDLLYLLNQKRRIVVASGNKALLPTLDQNMRDAGFLEPAAETDRASEPDPAGEVIESAELGDDGDEESEEAE